VLGLVSGSKSYSLSVTHERMLSVNNDDSELIGLDLSDLRDCPYKLGVIVTDAQDPTITASVFKDIVISR